MRETVQLRPTMSALVLGALLLAIWIAAVNYENNLSYLVLTTVGSIALVSIIHTQRNLTGLKVTARHPEPVFAGESARVMITIANTRAHPSFALTLDHPDLPNRALPLQLPLLKPGDSVVLEWIIPAPKRGIIRLPEIRASSQFPLGILRAWRRFTINAECVVYPRPDGHHAWTEGASDDPSAPAGVKRGGDDFHGLRPYVPGDPTRHIHWRAVARGGPVVIKEFSGGSSPRLRFEWEALDGLGPEERLSQLAQWIVQAEKLGSTWALAIPGFEAGPARGALHERACLRALALFRL